jgi:nickel-dependent lactate racemase
MLYTEIDLPYGNAVITAKVPSMNLSYILTSRDMKGLANESDAIINSLRHPIKSRTLVDCINENDRIVVLATDNTRPCPEERLLPPILAELERKVPRDNITIIIALGLHPPLDEPGLIKKLGKDIVAKYRVINHDINQTVSIGVTSRGTPVDINRNVIEADFRLSTGFIEPHFFAGFSGGRKSIAPGVFGMRSAYKNHGYSMIEHPMARVGILKGNPVHEDMVEQAKMARLDFIVNVILNKKREITHVVAGDPFKAHEQGCEIARGIVGVRAPHKVDITITTNNGAPLDMDLYQTCKGIDTAAMITRDDGIIIIASSCDEGVGPRAFQDLHCEFCSPQEVTDKVKLDLSVGVPWENQILARVQMKHDIFLFSNLDDSLVNSMMLKPISSVEAGLKQALEILGNDAKIAVIPEGPLVIPLLNG